MSVANKHLHHHAAFFADEGEENSGERAERVLYVASPLTIFNTQTHYDSNPFWPYQNGLSLKVLREPEVLVPVVTRTLYNSPLACNLKLTLGLYTHEQNLRASLSLYSQACIPLSYSQACIPLSYAAQIPTTPNPDLANVRVSLSNINQDVRQGSVRELILKIS